MLADRAGLTGVLSAALTRTGTLPVHDRGRVLIDLAVMIADGGVAVLAAHAPNLHSVLLAAKMAGYAHVNIDGT